MGYGNWYLVYLYTPGPLAKPYEVEHLLAATEPKAAKQEAQGLLERLKGFGEKKINPTLVYRYVVQL